MKDNNYYGPRIRYHWLKFFRGDLIYTRWVKVTVFGIVLLGNAYNALPSYFLPTTNEVGYPSTRSRHPPRTQARQLCSQDSEFYTNSTSVLFFLFYSICVRSFSWCAMFFVSYLRITYTRTCSVEYYLTIRAPPLNHVRGTHYLSFHPYHIPIIFISTICSIILFIHFSFE